MPVTNYTIVEGELLSESRAGTKRDYLPDPLGSTIALLDSTQTKTDTYSYWPYGEAKTHTGTSTTPFDWVGTLGYYRESTNQLYVRARYYRQNVGRWQTEDPIGFDGGDWNVYRYVENRPLTARDPSGLALALIIGGLAGAAGVGLGLGLCKNCGTCLNDLADNVFREIHRLPVKDIMHEQFRNALRHCIVSCEGPKRCGSICSLLIDLREFGQKDPDRQIDLCNNAIGRRLGSGSANCVTACVDSLRSGGLIHGPNDPRCRIITWPKPSEIFEWGGYS
jgi:RHS repeat-associated protein